MKVRKKRIMSYIVYIVKSSTKAEEEFVAGFALHEFLFPIWYTYPQLRLKNAVSRPGSNLDRRGGNANFLLGWLPPVKRVLCDQTDQWLLTA